MRSSTHGVARRTSGLRPTSELFHLRVEGGVAGIVDVVQIHLRDVTALANLCLVAVSEGVRGTGSPACSAAHWL